MNRTVVLVTNAHAGMIHVPESGEGTRWSGVVAGARAQHKSRYIRRRYTGKPHSTVGERVEQPSDYTVPEQILYHMLNKYE